MNIDLEKYEEVNSYRHSTDDPSFVINKIKEVYPESQGFKLDFKIEGASSETDRIRGSQTVVVTIYKEKTKKIHR